MTKFSSTSIEHCQTSAVIAAGEARKNALLYEQLRGKGGSSYSAMYASSYCTQRWDKKSKLLHASNGVQLDARGLFLGVYRSARDQHDGSYAHKALASCSQRTYSRMIYILTIEMIEQMIPSLPDSRKCVGILNGKHILYSQRQHSKRKPKT